MLRAFVETPLMRMLHVIESFAPGGMETTFLNVLRHVRDADDSVEHHVLALAGGALEEGYREAADEVAVGCDAATISRQLSGSYDVAYVLLERCAYRLLPELVARSTTPVVYGKGDDMGGMGRLKGGLRWQADESMLAACDGATFTNSNLAAGYDLPAGRTTILGTVADIARFQSIPAPPPPSTPQRIVCVEALHSRQGLDDLQQALDRVRADVPGAELTLVGADDRVAAVEDARIVAFPSGGDGVPAALLEGMAAGRPIVATAVGHIASIVDQGKEGFLVGAGDVQALGDRLTQLLLDPRLAATMGRAARARSAEHDVRVVARRLLRALRASA